MLDILRTVTPSPAQWLIVIDGARNSWESWERGDSYIDADGIFVFGPSDRALGLKLVGAGSDHAKFMRQMPLHLDVRAANYWWREFDTYRVGVAADEIAQNSTSMMHVVGCEPFQAEMFSLEDMDAAERDWLMDSLNVLRQRWIDAGKRKGPNAREWRALIQNIPDSWNYRRCVSLNYQAARAIYHARRNHRLSEWRTFCAAIEALPYAELITEAS